MSDQIDKKCLQFKRALTDPDDAARFDEYLDQYISNGFERDQAFVLAAEKLIEVNLGERGALIKDIESNGVKIENPDIDELLTPAKGMTRRRDSVPALSLFFNVLAGKPDAFQSLTSNAKRIDKIVSDMMPWASEIIQGREDDGKSVRITIRKEDGIGVWYESALTVHEENTSTPYVRISTDRGVGGSGIYQAAMAWAHNNGKTLVPDPAGITAINRLRRNEAMISSILRFRSVRHVEPHESQYVGLLDQSDYDILADEVRMDGADVMPKAIKEKLSKIKAKAWDRDNYHKSLHNLILSSAMIVKRRTAKLKERGISDEQIATSGYAGIGGTTLRRARLAEQALPELRDGRVQELVWLDDQAPSAVRVSGKVLADRIERAGVADLVFGRVQGSPNQRVLYKKGAVSGGSNSRQVEAWLSEALKGVRSNIKARVFIHEKTERVHDLDPDPYAPGLYYKGEIHLFANNIKTKRDAEVALAHELVGHYGLENVLGRERFMKLVERITQMRDSGNKAVNDVIRELKMAYVDENGNYNLDDLQEAREILAHLAEKNAKMGIVRQVWAWIKEWLSRFKLLQGRVVDRDIALIQKLIVLASRGIQSGTTGRTWSAIDKTFDEILAGYEPVEVNAVAEPGPDIIQPDLFAEVEPEVAADIIDQNFSRIYESAPEGEINIGLDEVISPEQAAHVFAPLRKRGQEAFYILALDENHRPISMIRHSEGMRDSSLVYPITAAAAIVNTPGVKHIYYGHNHPSGDPKPSSNDYMVTQKINRFLDGTGIEVDGHIVVGEGRKASYFLDSEENMRPIKTAAARRNKRVSITVRKIKKRRPVIGTISKPDDAKFYVSIAPTGNGVIFLDQRHNIIGYWSVDPEKAGNLRESGELATVLKIVDKTNASAVILYAEARHIQSLKNLGGMLGENGHIRVLDLIESEGLTSFSEAGADIRSQVWHKINIKTIDELRPGPVQRVVGMRAAKRLPMKQKSAAIAILNAKEAPTKSDLSEALLAEHKEIRSSQSMMSAVAVSTLPEVPAGVDVYGQDAGYFVRADQLEEPAGPFDIEADAANYARTLYGLPTRDGGIEIGGSKEYRIKYRISGNRVNAKLSEKPSDLPVRDAIGVADAIVSKAADLGATELSGGFLSNDLMRGYIEQLGGKTRFDEQGRIVMDVSGLSGLSNVPAYARKARIKSIIEREKRNGRKPEKGAAGKYLGKIMRGKKMKAIIDETPGLAERLKEHEGTAWAMSAKKAAIIRHEIKKVADGKMDFRDSPLFSSAIGAAIEANGIDGVFDYLEHSGVIGVAGKPGANVNSSFRNCEPSKLCAAVCYAANGRSGMFPANLMKEELLEIAAETDPKRLASMIAAEHRMNNGANWKKEALRMFEAGDLSPAFVDVIDELNSKGIRAQVFSKRPELLAKLDKKNALMLSIDKSNYQIAEGTDFPLSIVYTGKEDAALFERFADRFDPLNGNGVILPIETRSGYVEPDGIKALPDNMKNYLCPVNIGKWSGNNALGACSRCQVGIGCYKNRPTIEVNFDSVLGISKARREIEAKIKSEDISHEELETAEREALRILERINAARDARRAAAEGALGDAESDLRDQGQTEETGGRDSDLNEPAYSRRQYDAVELVVGRDSDGNRITVMTTHPSMNRRSKLRALWEIWIKKAGGLDDKAFLRKTEMEGMKNADELSISFAVAEMQRAVKDRRSGYGKPYSKLTDAERQEINARLNGDSSMELPPAVQESVDAMRTMIDGASSRLQETIVDNLRYRLDELRDQKLADSLRFVSAYRSGADEAMLDDLAEKADPYVVARVRLLQTITENKGRYITRSYQIFDDPKWADNAREDESIMTPVRAMFTAEFEAQGLTGKSLDDAVEGKINSILFKASRSRDMLSFMYSDLLGQKDTSILKRRKDIPPEIRALLGEYKDPRLNFARTMSKMTYFVANHYFLKKIREDGMGVYLSKEPRGRFAVKLDDFDKESLRPIQGLYTTPEIHAALKEATDSRVFEGWVRGALAINSAVKMGKTVLSPTTAMRNFYSAMMFSVANGHFNPMYSIRAAQHTFADLFTKSSSSRSYLEKMVRLGVLHDNPYSSELNEAIKDFTSTDTYSDAGAKKAVKAALMIAQHFYQSGDDFWKIIGFENEKAMLKRAGLSERAAEREAARRIRDTYPTYSQVPKVIRELRRFPIVGTFTSFPWEIARTSSNIVRVAAADAKAGRVEMASRRLVGVAIAAAASWAVSRAMMAALGLDEDDDKNIHELVPEWQRNAELAYIGYDDEGRLRWLDLSHLDPYTYIKEPARILLNDINGDIDERLLKASWTALEPFISSEIGWEAIDEVRNNIDYETGRKIVPEGTPADKAAALVINHLRKSMQPGLADNAERIAKAIAQVVEPNGRIYKTRDELAALAGLRYTTLDIEEAVIYRAADELRKARESSTELSRVIRSMRDIDEEDVKDVANRYLESRDKILGRVVRAAMAARALGKSEKEVFQLLSLAGFSKRDASVLAQGRIPPYMPSKSTLKSAQRRAQRRRKEAVKEIGRRFRLIEKLSESHGKN